MNECVSSGGVFIVRVDKRTKFCQSFPDDVPFSLNITKIERDINELRKLHNLLAFYGANLSV